MDQNLSNKVERFKELIDHVLGTDKGQELLGLLKEEYCDRSSLRNSPELTYYCLGQKELVELLENILKDDEFVQKTIVKTQVNNEF